MMYSVLGTTIFFFIIFFLIIVLASFELLVLIATSFHLNYTKHGEFHSPL